MAPHQSTLITHLHLLTQTFILIWTYKIQNFQCFMLLARNINNNAAKGKWAVAILKRKNELFHQTLCWFVLSGPETHLVTRAVILLTPYTRAVAVVAASKCQWVSLSNQPWCHKGMHNAGALKTGIIGGYIEHEAAACRCAHACCMHRLWQGAGRWPFGRLT